MRRRRSPEVIGGRVLGDGSVQSATSPDFTVQRTGVGVYVLTFAAAFRPVAVVAGSANQASIIAAVGPVVGQTVTVNTYTAATAALSDQVWSFVAMGVQT